MAMRIDEQATEVTFEVLDVFDPDDANQIEAAVDAQHSQLSVLVDFRRAREKHMLALWLLTLAVRQDPSRFRLIGLTRADLRFLDLMGGSDLATRVH
jgi:predicted component of type VI protein secretion system